MKKRNLWDSGIMLSSMAVSLFGLSVTAWANDVLVMAKNTPSAVDRKAVEVDAASQGRIVSEYVEKNGKKQYEIDELGIRTDYKYDKAGRLVEAVRDGLSTKMEYDQKAVLCVPSIHLRAPARAFTISKEDAPNLSIRSEARPRWSMINTDGWWRRKAQASTI